MDPRTQAFLLANPPLGSPVSALDPFTHVRVDPARPGGILVTTGSGRMLAGELTTGPVGVLRLRLALDLPARKSSPMLMDCTAEPLEVRPAPDGIAARSPEISVSWQLPGSGLVVGPLRSAPVVATVLGPPARSGLLLGQHDEPAGFLFCFGLGPDVAVFGGGECYQGPNLYGRLRRCVNVEAQLTAGSDVSYLSVPFFWSDDGWGVYWHTGAPVRADIGATHSSVFALDSSAAAADLYCYAGSAPEILDAHQRVTGRPGRLPEWALGVWTSRCTYLSAAEIDEVLAGYAAADCPVDVVHIDAWQVGNVCRDFTTAWEIDRDRFPEGWARRLAERGVRVSLWQNPYLSPGSPVGLLAAERGYVMRDAHGTVLSTNDLPNRMLVDFTNPDACTWWRQLVRSLVQAEGVSAVKPDFAEEVPPAAHCHNASSGWAVRNEYALRYQAESYAGLAEATGTDAVALFCRSGTAGSQRYPTHWVGDTPSTWEGMAAALRGCLSLSLSGFGYVTSDIGGFWAPADIFTAEYAIDHNDPSVFTADVEPELFARWAQWGALSPLMRFHGSGRREPWAYPGAYGEAAVQACWLRKALAAYLGRAAAEANTFGIPMMRPMPLACPDQRAARDAGLQYLLGPDLLVAPVLARGGRVQLWVPPGEWIGVAGAPALSGPGWVSVQLALATPPAWSRAGVSVLSQR